MSRAPEAVAKSAARTPGAPLRTLRRESISNGGFGEATPTTHSPIVDKPCTPSAGGLFVVRRPSSSSLGASNSGLEKTEEEKEKELLEHLSARTPGQFHDAIISISQKIARFVRLVNICCKSLKTDGGKALEKMMPLLLSTSDWDYACRHEVSKQNKYFRKAADKFTDDPDIKMISFHMLITNHCEYSSQALDEYIKIVKPVLDKNIKDGTPEKKTLKDITLYDVVALSRIDTVSHPSEYIEWITLLLKRVETNDTSSDETILALAEKISMDLKEKESLYKLQSNFLKRHADHFADRTVLVFDAGVSRPATLGR